MPILKSSFRTSKIMSNGHLQTIYPFLFRKIKASGFDNERVELTDGDFIDLDFFKSSSKTLVIISHGLEGSSDKAYSRGLAKTLHNQGLDVIAWNMRSCSKEINRLPTFYHGAQVDDLDAVIDHAKKTNEYKKIILVGFSLGGNLVAYYAGKIGKKNHNEIDGCIAISATIDLESSIHKLNSNAPGKLYSELFLATMRKKALTKIESGLLNMDPEIIKSCKDFIDFDAKVTAPTFGFDSAHDYYDFASAVNYIENTNIPLYFIQAQDDPFLAEISYPIELAKEHEQVHLEITPYGGHVGFIEHKFKFNYWIERRVPEILREL